MIAGFSGVEALGSVDQGGKVSEILKVKVSNSTCQEGNSTKAVISRSLEKKRPRVPAIATAWRHRPSADSATVWKRKAMRLRVTKTAARLC